MVTDMAYVPKDLILQGLSWEQSFKLILTPLVINRAHPLQASQMEVLQLLGEVMTKMAMATAYLPKDMILQVPLREESSGLIFIPLVINRAHPLQVSPMEIL